MKDNATLPDIDLEKEKQEIFSRYRSLLRALKGQCTADGVCIGFREVRATVLPAIRS